MCKLFKEKKSTWINAKNIDDNKKFWKTVKPFFSNKGLNSNKLILIEKNNLISEESVLANTMNQYFTIITKQLKKPEKISRIKEIGRQH